MDLLPNELIDKIILNIEYPDIIKFRSFLTTYAYYQSMSNNIIDVIKSGDINNLNHIKKDIDKISYTIFDIIIIHGNLNHIYNLMLWSYYNNYQYTIMSLNILSFLECPYKKEMILKFLYNKKYKFSKIHYSVGVRTNNIELIKFLIKIGIDKDHASINYAIEQKNYKMVKWLLENNIGNNQDVFYKIISIENAYNEHNKTSTLLSYALECEYIPINIKKIKHNVPDIPYLQFILIHLLGIKNLNKLIKEEITIILKNL
jgi:hypothetical protein